MHSIAGPCFLLYTTWCLVVGSKLLQATSVCIVIENRDYKGCSSCYILYIYQTAMFHVKGLETVDISLKLPC